MHRVPHGPRGDGGDVGATGLGVGDDVGCAVLLQRIRSLRQDPPPGDVSGIAGKHRVTGRIPGITVLHGPAVPNEHPVQFVVGAGVGEAVGLCVGVVVGAGVGAAVVVSGKARKSPVDTVQKKFIRVLHAASASRAGVLYDNREAVLTHF